MCCDFGIVLLSSVKFDASPTYDSVVVTVVGLEDLPSSGHSAFFLQLQLGS